MIIPLDLVREHSIFKSTKAPPDFILKNKETGETAVVAVVYQGFSVAHLITSDGDYDLHVILPWDPTPRVFHALPLNSLPAEYKELYDEAVNQAG